MATTLLVHHHTGRGGLFTPKQLKRPHVRIDGPPLDVANIVTSFDDHYDTLRGFRGNGILSLGENDLSAVLSCVVSMGYELGAQNGDDQRTTFTYKRKGAYGHRLADLFVIRLYEDHILYHGGHKPIHDILDGRFFMPESQCRTSFKSKQAGGGVNREIKQQGLDKIYECVCENGYTLNERRDFPVESDSLPKGFYVEQVFYPKEA
jgi:hypothetical protein